MNLTKLLEVYSLVDILEYNDIPEEEALGFLVTQGFLELPEFEPLDFE